MVRRDLKYMAYEIAYELSRKIGIDTARSVLEQVLTLTDDIIEEIEKDRDRCLFFVRPFINDYLRELKEIEKGDKAEVIKMLDPSKVADILCSKRGRSLLAEIIRGAIAESEGLMYEYIKDTSLMRELIYDLIDYIESTIYYGESI